MFRYQLLAFRSINFLVMLVLILLAGLSFALFHFKKARLFTLVLLVLSILATSISLFVVHQFVGLTDRLNTSSTTTNYSMRIVVLKDSEISELSQVSEVMAPQTTDGSNIQKLVDQLKNKEQKELRVQDTVSYLAAY
ncbi:LCP family protein [Streptococcus oralis]|nr:LCP family protein [Streptococcus oralis]